MAQDIHYNKSPVAFVSSPSISLNLTLFIEGFYNQTANLQVSDTIKVYLRNTVSPFNKVDSAAGVVSANGIAALNFGNAASGTYYVVVTHRNSIETWSKSGGESLIRGSALNYDFSNSSVQAYGNNMKQIDSSPVRFGIYSADVTRDGLVNLNDIILTYNNAAGFVNGYVITDVTGDNVTNLNDLIIAFNNSSMFVGVRRP